jgi:hypothetical protein
MPLLSRPNGANEIDCIVLHAIAAIKFCDAETTKIGRAHKFSIDMGTLNSFRLTKTGPLKSGAKIDGKSG